MTKRAPITLGPNEAEHYAELLDTSLDMFAENKAPGPVRVDCLRELVARLRGGKPQAFAGDVPPTRGQPPVPGETPEQTRSNDIEYSLHAVVAKREFSSSDVAAFAEGDGAP